MVESFSYGSNRVFGCKSGSSSVGTRSRGALRDPKIQCSNTRPPIHLHQIPLEDRPNCVEKLSKVMDGCDTVYHLAGMFDPSDGGVLRMTNLHVFGTRALLRAAEKVQVRRFVHCSSSITIGFGDLDHLGNEKTVLDPTSVYGPSGALRGYYNSKNNLKNLVLGWKGVSGVVVNPDYIIGPYDIKPTSGQLILQNVQVLCSSLSERRKMFLGARDCALAHIAAVEKRKSRGKYLLGYHNLSYKDFMSKISDITGQKAPIAPFPKTLVRALTKVGPFLNQIDAHRFAGLEPNVFRAMQQSRYRDGSKMVAELGITPTPMEQSIEDCYRWFVDHGHVS